jgi:hypothetical protein
MDPTKKMQEEQVAPTIPVDFAMERMEVSE